MLKRYWQKLDLFFPEKVIFQRNFSTRTSIFLFLGLTITFSLGGLMIPADGFFGWDWVHFFGINRIPPFYPPWTFAVLRFMTWPLLIGITMASFVIATIKRSVHPISAVAALLCLPLIWTIFLGQLEGLVVLGLLGIPWLMPLILLKPQISFFALGARKQYIVVFLIFIMISMVVWGFWMVKMLSANSYYGEGRYEQDISLQWWGLPIFLLTIWFSRGDPDMLMVSGAFITPHLIVYNLLPLSPAIARLGPRAAILASFFSWLTLSSNWLGPNGWWLGWIYVGWLWILLAARRYPTNGFSKIMLSIFG